MAVVFTVKSNTAKTLRLFNNLQTKFPEKVGLVSHDLAKHTQRMVRRQFTITKGLNNWSGKTYRSIQAKKQTNTKSVLTIRREGIWVDSMRPHYVSLKRGRNITGWARSKGIKGRVIHVKPKPFIQKGIQRATINYPKLIRRRVKQALENSK